MAATMKRIPLSTIVEIATLTSIVIGLLIIVFELRNNTLQLKTQTIQSVLEQHQSDLRQRIDNEELRRIRGKILATKEPLSDEELVIYRNHFRTTLNTYDNAYQQYLSGTLPENIHKVMQERLKGFMRNRISQQLWALEERRAFTSEFVSYLHSEIL